MQADEASVVVVDAPFQTEIGEPENDVIRCKQPTRRRI